ncbi:MAG: class I tRNA ligase family protein, partial [Terriglobales bacterium]
AYAGLDRFEARRRIVAALEAQGLLAGVREHPMAVGHCQRCRSVVEPRLSTQWFVKIAPLAAEAIAAVDEGHITFTPANYRGIYLDWMANIHDWCISRQLWWGHRIPAWHCRAEGRLIVSREDPAQCPHCGGPVEQDPDVLDTWFSSALWPFSTLGWPEQTADLATFYPTSLLITGFDILFFWVARMIMMGVHFGQREGKSLAASVPFRQVYIHGLVRDAEKQKMSKTKGNVIDPMVVTEKYGTDAVRFTLAAMAAPGTDIALSEARMDGYRAFANKIWNAARFIFMSLDRAETEFGWRRPAAPREAARGPRGGGLADRWIFSRLNALAARVNDSLAAFRFHDAADGLYHFFWHEFCDWYLELAKLSFSGGGQEPARETADNLFFAFDAALRLLHPLMPFITEELWRTLAGEHPPAPTLALAAFPAAGPVDSEAEREMALVQAVVSAVRKLRAEAQAAPKARLGLRAEGRDAEVNAVLERQAPLITALAGVEMTVEAVPADAGRGHVAAPEFRLLLELPAADSGAERERLEKEIAGLERALAGVEARLADAQFQARAPEHIRAEQRRKAGEYSRQLGLLRRSLEALV